MVYFQKKIIANIYRLWGAQERGIFEPTTGLDAASAERNRAAIAHESARGATVVCVSHDDRLISEADHVVELDAGRVRVAHASPEGVRAARAPVR